jgi:2-methylcitrate dehydratase PrpD
MSAGLAFQTVTKSSSFSETLIALLFEIDRSAISESAIDAALLCIEDTIGVSIAAAAIETATAGGDIAPLVDRQGAVLWGRGRLSTPEGAALANGMLAHGLDFDDTHPAAIMHASAINVPVALALGQTLGTPPDELLTALVLSYEISARLGRLAPGPFQDRGFQSTAVLGIFAAAFLAARLMRVSPEVAINAMGVAGSMASGLMEYLSDGTDVKQLHTGWAAQAGIQAVRLAAAGLTGPRTVLEGRFGVYKAYADLTVDPSTVLAPLRDSFEVELMAPKPYPACLCVHPVVQAALDLRQRGVLGREKIDAIREIHCEVPEWYVNLVFQPLAEKAKPITAYDGKFSASYCLARTALDGDLGVRSFVAEKLHEPDVRRLAAKVTCRARDFEEFPASFPALVRVTMTNGEQHESLIRHNLGSAQAPLSAADIESKFRSNVEFAIGRDAAAALHASIAGLARSANGDELWSALGQARIAR